MSEANKQLIANETSFLSTESMEKITGILQSMLFGNLTLISQNFRLIQIDRNEKIRAADLDKYIKKSKNDEHFDYSKVCQKIRQQFDGLEYGQIIIVVNNGIVTRIERIEKHRFDDFTGLDGEGI